MLVRGRAICNTLAHFEVFFGGARRGGKTDGMLGEWASYADLDGAHAIDLMVRRERTQLVEAVERARALFAPLGARFNEHDWMRSFPNGARLRFACTTPRGRPSV